LREEHHLIKENLKKNKNSYPAPRQIFFDTFPFLSSQKKIDHVPLTSVIGLHMTPSGMTSNPLSRDFIYQLMHTLLSYPIKLILFGTQAELSCFESQKNDRISFASHENIIENLAQVQYCDVMIAADSVFKTMSSMAKIPTIIFYEDLKSHFRDRVFIEPYVRNDIMFTYKYAYQSLEGVKIRSAIDFIMTILKDQLKLI
jgi:ADP-heptose:LPS heptosyltransferase